MTDITIDITHFSKENVLDTCSAWNILSSNFLLSVSQQAGCIFYLTAYVLYECLYKPRKDPNAKELELQRRLKRLLQLKKITKYNIDIEDLQDIEILEKRRKLGKGELSSMVLAKKFYKSFLTDDQKARVLAKTILDRKDIQTTPHLFGWLVYIEYIGDVDKDIIINEHNELNRPLEKYLKSIFNHALQCRLIPSSGKESSR